MALTPEQQNMVDILELQKEDQEALLQDQLEQLDRQKAIRKKQADYKIAQIDAQIAKIQPVDKAAKNSK